VVVRRRSPGGDRAGLIDALIVAAGTAVVSWVFLIAPFVGNPDLEVAGQITSAAYPVADLTAAAVAARLVTGGRTATFRLVGAAVLVTLASDSIYVAMQLSGTYQAGGGPTDIPLIVAAWVAVLLLVVARLAGLFHVQEQAVRRERVLREAGAGLVTATSPADSETRMLAGVRTLLAGVPARAAILHRDGEVAFRVAAAAEEGGGCRLPAGAVDRLRERQTVELRPDQAPELAAALDPAGTCGVLLLDPLVFQGGLRGALAVASVHPLPADLRDAIASLVRRFIPLSFVVPAGSVRMTASSARRYGSGPRRGFSGPARGAGARSPGRAARRRSRPGPPACRRSRRRRRPRRSGR
jgi:hypothetical protein